MAHKGYWLARCMHMEGDQCKCPNNSRKQQKWPQHPAVPVPARADKKTEFTLRQLKAQTATPVITVDTAKSLQRYKIQGFCNKILQKAKREAVGFVQGKAPILPQENSLASIDLTGRVTPQDILETVKVCFELKSMYIQGVLVGKDFYELRKSDDKTWLVDGSIALECGATYYEMFGHQHNPLIELSDFDLVEAFNVFVSLAPEAPRSLLQAAARCIAMVSLILIEPSRQWDMAKNMCSGNQSDTKYLIMQLGFWQSVHSWDSRSKVAKGIEYKNGEIEEKVEQDKRLEAIKFLRIVNSTKKLPVKKDY